MPTRPTQPTLTTPPTPPDLGDLSTFNNRATNSIAYMTDKHADDQEMLTYTEASMDYIESLDGAQYAADAQAAALAAGAPIYADTTAGLAGVSEGEYFYVPESGQLALYQDLSGVATLVLRTPITGLKEWNSVSDLFGDTDITYTTGGFYTVIPGKIIRAAQYTYEVMAAATDDPPFTINGVKMQPLPIGPECFLSQYNGQEGTDCLAKLQNMVDQSQYLGHKPGGRNVVIDLERIELSATLHLGYGTNSQFSAVDLRGLGARYRNGDRNSGTNIDFTATAGAAINFQGQRTSRLSGVRVEGAGFSGIQTAVGTTTRALMDKATWDTPLGTAGITTGDRYSPHMCVGVDLYSGAAPGNTQPTVTYPSFLSGGPHSQYNKTASSKVEVERFEFVGAEVGFGLHTSNVTANGDFVVLSDGLIEFCAYGISLGDDQARGSHIQRVRFSGVHTCITNDTHGMQKGRLNAFCEGIETYGNCGQIFKLGNAAEGGRLHIVAGEFESICRLGEISESNTDVSATVLLEGCRIKINQNFTDDFVPPNLIEGSWDDGVTLQDCRVQVPYIASMGNGWVNIENSVVVPNEAIDESYLAHVQNLSAGGWFLRPLEDRTINTRMRVYDVDTPSNALVDTPTNETFALGGRNHCIPHYVREGLCEGNGTFENKRINAEFIDNSADLTSISRTDRVITMTVAQLTSSNTDLAYLQACLPGCAWLHYESGTVLALFSADTGTGVAKAVMLNNYYNDGTNYQIYDSSFDPATADYYALNGLIYTPQYAIWGTVTEGSAVITEVEDIFGGSTATNYGLTVGDRLGGVNVYQGEAMFSGSSKLAITAIDTGAKTITLSGNASVTGRFKLSYWMRTPPANLANP